MEAKIEKVVLRIDDKEIELTVEAARNLRELLTDLLGERGETVYVPYPLTTSPVIYRTYPDWTWRPYTRTGDYGTAGVIVTFSSSGS